MNLVFLGPPGAGKGTMAARLSSHAGIPHISTGEIFRSNIKNQTELGTRVKAILDAGDLVPDDLTIELVRDRLEQPDAAAGFILDGFPRTTPQADALGQMVSVDTVVNFVLDDAEIVRRLSGRRIHPGSGRTYHVEFSPPQEPGIDDVTGEPLVQRDDDTRESIENRLAVYREQTAPLIQYYRERGTLVDLDACPAPDEVFSRLTALLDA